MALRVQIYKLSCKHLNVGRFIRNGEGRSINIRFYANYIAAKPKRYRPSASKLLQPNKGNQIDYKSFVTKVYFWPLRSFVGYIGQGVNRAGGRVQWLTLDIYARLEAAVRDKALMEAHQPAIWHFTPCPRTG